ncbi:MAG: SRPBCC family protein [Gemmatimonadetes bacterium]|nr:SRPBCC family protein [Gemmatimonadota bacterium]
MPQITAGASAVVHAPPATVYGILSDYHEGHPAILPRPPFGALVVESGGTGAGTVFRVQTRQGLAMRTYRMAVTEPEPGRLLVETAVDSDLVSTFRVEPVEGGHSRVTITTRWTRGGVQGLVERLLVPALAAPIYRKEIANLERLARERTGGTQG